QVALWKFDAAVGTYDIWLMDVVRGIASRFTFDPASDLYSVWSPDDKEIVFSLSRHGPFNLYRKKTDGTEAEQPLHVFNRNELALDWSPDRRLLVYEQRATDARQLDIFALPLDGGEPLPLATTNFDERLPSVSPTGRWLAYLSNESGTYEVYVQRF